MIWRKLLQVSVLILFASIQGRSQTAKALPVGDIYTNFEGNWVGFREHLVKGKLVQKREKILVTRVPNKHRVRFDYTVYDDPETFTWTRSMALDPIKAKMTLYYDGGDEERYKATGLETFAQTGFGTFAAFRPTEDGGDTKKITRVTIDLKADALNITWEVTTDGQNYKVYSFNSFKRESTSSNTKSPGKN
jgi:hypothetical protein